MRRRLFGVAAMLAILIGSTAKGLAENGEESGQLLKVREAV
jgi:hypothetical protein